MKKLSLSITLLIALNTIFCQGRFDDVVIKTNKVSSNLYMLEGSGGNIAILVGDEGTLMIDNQFADLSPKIQSAIKELGSYPVTYLVNTHLHGDHTGGNTNFGNDGAIIVAHDNVRKRMSKDQIRPFRKNTPAAPESALPKVTFNDNMKLYFNGDTIHLIHVHNAHTDGDSFIYFEKANVLHMGDCFFKNRFPFIDTNSGGTPDGYIKASAAALMLCNTDTKIIPGHGTLATKEDLMNFYMMLNTMRDRVKESISKGHDMEEALSNNLTEGYAEWGTGFINDEKIVKTLFSFYESN